MAVCSLLKEECIEEQCAWWWQEFSQCAVTSLVERLGFVRDDIVEQLEGTKTVLEFGLGLRRVKEDD